MKKFYVTVTALWLMILGREVFRCLLALSGDLEWRGWNYGLDFWPSYVTMWDALMIPVAMWWVWFNWKQLEWKGGK